jgi:hypothetical protein
MHNAHDSKAVQGHRTSGRRSLGEGASKTLARPRTRLPNSARSCLARRGPAAGGTQAASAVTPMRDRFAPAVNINR